MHDKRVILIVLDSAGIGETHDSAEYGDYGADTLGHIKQSVSSFELHNLQRIGLGCISGVTGYNKCLDPQGSFARLLPASSGKDTTSGHWEIAGLIIEKPFPTFLKGFPEELIIKFEKAINQRVIGGTIASGTEIINRLGDEHLNTGYPIIYTSPDSVFQIAAHEDIFLTEELYGLCNCARKLLVGEYGVGRVIARPFKGRSGAFERKHDRKDFSLEPFSDTFLDLISSAGMEVKTVGKIEDIFAGKGITSSNHASGNAACIDATIAFIKEKFSGLIFTNLVDFDMKYGHRRDVAGYAGALEYFDKRLEEIFSTMNRDDVVIITADHGCDPTYQGTDHTREAAPLLVYGESVRRNVNCGILPTYSVIASTVCDYLGVSHTLPGESMASKIF